jgi:hypothetical protein
MKLVPCPSFDIVGVLCRYPGFLKLKYQTKAGLPVAFVEFQVPYFSAVP